MILLQNLEIAFSKMKLAVCVVFASIFVNTVKALESKQVNLALETVLNFDKKDRVGDLTVIDKVQKFLNQIKNGMRRGNSRRSANHEITFTKFIVEAAKILKEYDDTDLEDAYVIIKDETRRYINKKSEFQNLFHTNDMRRFISDQLDEAKDMPADAVRESLDAIVGFVEAEKRIGEKDSLLEIGNSLYDGASDKFLKALRDLNKLRRASETNLERVLRNTLKTLVFDHYTSLDDHVKGELVNMVKHYWRAFAGKRNRKHIRSKPKTVDVAPYRHESKDKHHNRQTNNYKTEKPHKTHQNYKSDEIDVKDTHIDFLTDHELTKQMNDKETVEEKHKSHFSQFADKNMPKKSLHNKSKVGRDEPSTQLAKKRVRIGDRREKQHDSQSSEPEVLMGGQLIRQRNVHFRGSESASRDSSEASDRAEIDGSTEEIVIQHNNIVDIGLSRKTPGKINITFVSPEKHETDNSRESASGESMSIEMKLTRKSNMNDTLETNPNPNNQTNVNMLIENIEKLIRDVKNQVEYVKNLTKTNSNYKELERIVKKEPENVTESTKNVTVAVTTETNSGFAFRAREDSDVNYDSLEENASIKEVESKPTITTVAADANITDENKSDKQNSSESINVNNTTNTNKLIERESGDKSTTFVDTTKFDDVNNVTSTTHDDRLNEKDEEHNVDDLENAITENSTTSLLVDLKIDA